MFLISTLLSVNIPHTKIKETLNEMQITNEQCIANLLNSVVSNVVPKYGGYTVSEKAIPNASHVYRKKVKGYEKELLK